MSTRDRHAPVTGPGAKALDTHRACVSHLAAVGLHEPCFVA
jgi:hypothetical protein